MTADREELARLLEAAGLNSGFVVPPVEFADRLLAAGVTPPGEAGRADAERLREALSKYGRHQVNCAAQRGDEPDCNCGLRAALARTGGSTDGE